MFFQMKSELQVSFSISYCLCWGVEKHWLISSVVTEDPEWLIRSLCHYRLWTPLQTMMTTTTTTEQITVSRMCTYLCQVHVEHLVLLCDSDFNKINDYITLFCLHFLQDCLWIRWNFVINSYFIFRWPWEWDQRLLRDDQQKHNCFLKFARNTNENVVLCILKKEHGALQMVSFLHGSETKCFTLKMIIKDAMQ